ncbi:unnamed protein product [Caenorhabditis auriculariae]|uniref:Uncharacterized protein n=1 Tax=Caenorhabditis auriculariae TaxID=2777116 RepID=A0A8S1HN29_9PELO|nr:unnamed protein product [Caenorhabditis auriculariae]
MVAPSCCLEYRPTATLLFIILFVIFPLIYVCGRVTTCALTIVFRIAKGLCQFLFFEPEELDEEVSKQLEEREKRRAERRRRREQKIQLKAQLLRAQFVEASVTADPVELMLNGDIAPLTALPDVPTTTVTTTKVVVEKSSDISDSLNSENETEEFVANGVDHHRKPLNGVLTNGHARK